MLLLVVWWLLVRTLYQFHALPYPSPFLVLMTERVDGVAETGEENMTYKIATTEEPQFRALFV